jgi:hypothetical protein
MNTNQPVRDEAARGCANCGHALIHDRPCGTVADCCPYPGCNCGYYIPADDDSERVPASDEGVGHEFDSVGADYCVAALPGTKGEQCCGQPRSAPIHQRPIPMRDISGDAAEMMWRDRAAHGAPPVHEAVEVEPDIYCPNCKSTNLSETRNNCDDCGWQRGTDEIPISPPPGEEERPIVPPTALYWLKNAKDETYSMAERLLYMENAYNHVVNALFATPAAGWRDIADALDRIQKCLDSASDERYQELKEWEREARQHETDKDMYGWNFKMGMAAGANYTDIYYRRIGREIEAIRESLPPPPDAQSLPSEETK